MGSPECPSPTRKIEFESTEPPRGVPAKPIVRTNTPWPPEKAAPTKGSCLSAILKPFLPKTSHKPEFDVNAIRAQTISNALAIATMACVHADYAGEILKVDDPKLLIVTTNECDQVRAAVVYYQYQPGQHSTVRTVFQSSLAGSDVEALLSLYEESKRMATDWKANLESRGLWSLG